MGTSVYTTMPSSLQSSKAFGSTIGDIITFLKPYFAEKEKTEDRFNILLEEIKILREEGERRWQEAIRRLDEHLKILQEHNKRLEEHSKILQEQSRKLDEHSKILEEQNRRLEEHSKKLELLTQELISLRKRQDVQIGALGARWGLLTSFSSSFLTMGSISLSKAFSVFFCPLKAESMDIKKWLRAFS